MAPERTGLTSTDQGLIYMYRARMMGPVSRFCLSGDHLDWSVGAQSGRLRLADVERVRLVYLPGQIVSPSYEVRLTTRAGLDLRIGSLSRTSMTLVEDNRAAYAQFLAALHGALAPHAGRIRFVAGFPVWRWRLLVGLGALTLAGVMTLLIRAMLAGEGGLAIVLCALGALLAWPILEMAWRNRPASYSPMDPPMRLAPG